MPQSQSPSYINVHNIHAVCSFESTPTKIVCDSSTLISNINPLNAKLNPICHLLALLDAHHILHISKIRVNILIRNS